MARMASMARMAPMAPVVAETIEILKQGGSAYHLLQRCSEKIAFTRSSISQAA